MPYLGKDWRSPGSSWVRTGKGWEIMMSLRANINKQVKKLARQRFLSGKGVDKDEIECDFASDSSEHTGYDLESYPNQVSDYTTAYENPKPAYIFLPKNNRSREQSVYITIGEVLRRLDLCPSVRDHRRFNYVCKILELIITSKFTELGGMAQKNLFLILQEVVNIVLETKENKRILENLLKQTEDAMNKCKNDDGYIGCASVWNKRMNLVLKWQEQVQNSPFFEREDDDGLMLEHLPDDCVRAILLRLSRHEDVLNSGATNSILNKLSNEGGLWKEMCYFHFKTSQIKDKISSIYGEDQADFVKDNVNLPWKRIYKMLYKKHGRRECYADMLHLCPLCNCLFWKGAGHPCSWQECNEKPNVPTRPIPVDPHAFIKLFSPDDCTTGGVWIPTFLVYLPHQ